MIVSGGGEVVGITPWSASVERKGTCGSMTYSKLRIKGRLNAIEEPDWGAEVDTEAAGGRSRIRESASRCGA